MLACTSDKGSLHIFDVPNPRNQQFTPPPPAPSGSAPNTEARNKWGILSNIPFGPFADIYSFTSTPFETGEEPLLPTPRNHSGGEAVLGTSRPVKGVIGWIDESTLIVVGAGQDARWEKFVLREGENGRSVVVREGWKKYLGN